MKLSRFALPLSTLLVLAACGTQAPEAQRTDRVVYGTDDRTDVYADTDPRLRQLAAQSIVALMQGDAIDYTNPSDLHFLAYSLGQVQNLCAGQRFTTDPAAAFCSGTLIDNDLVLTAGHCITTQADCDRARIVFGYYNDAAGSLHTVTRDDVYSCRSIIVRRLDDPGSPELDYAIIRVDRPATPRFVPARVRTTNTAVSFGQTVDVIGCGSGIPFKIDSGGNVRDSRSSVRDYFIATTDTFQGNSGSGVFDDSSLDLVGILVRGDSDYVPSGSCNIVHQCSESGCSGEASTYAFRAIQDLCTASGSAALCGSAVQCGDGRCDVGETPAGCASDCGTSVPAGWTCAAGSYGSGDQCDCNCGARDPDCDDTTLRLVGCPSGDTCGAAGQCVRPAPRGWTCPAANYAAGDACDCNCGIFDPDCMDPTRTVMNCARGQVCGTDGRCTTAAPAGWSCPPEYYAAGDVCDCACGLHDPDCDNPALMLSNCSPGQACTTDGRCVTAPPAGWTCAAEKYRGGDACDCECGIVDPDCANSALPVRGCPGTELCGSDAHCVAGTPPPAGWTCPPESYAAGDACDCNCGPRDPDCDNAALPVVDCVQGQVCSSAGTCIDPGSDAGNGNDAGNGTDAAVAGDGGTHAGNSPGCACSIPGSPRRSTREITGVACMALAGALVRRSRRRQ